MQNQYRENQRKTEKYWSDLTNTWAAEKICKDDKIHKLNSALEVAHEQQLAIEQRWKNAVEEEKKEKLAQVNQLIERVNGMEVKQSEIRQDMEQKLRAVREQVQEKYQKNVKMMQEDYQKRLEQEVQQYISNKTKNQEIGSLPIVGIVDHKTSSQRKALETAKKMVHQGRGELRSPEIDWDYYGTHAHDREQDKLGTEIPRIANERGLPKRAASTPLEGGQSVNYQHLAFQRLERNILVKTVKVDMNHLCVGVQIVGDHIWSVNVHLVGLQRER